MSDDQELIINAAGTKAIVTYYDDSMSHDSSYYQYTVNIQFADPALNPPDQGYWEAGAFDCSYREFSVVRVMEVARQFYDFLMAFRTDYGKEETINGWRNRLETVSRHNQDNLHAVQDLKDILRLRESRIKELETGYIKKLEGELLSYKTVVECARKRLLEDVKLLTIKEDE